MAVVNPLFSAETVRQAAKKETVLAHFVGASSRSTSLDDVVRRLCHELNEALGLDEEISEDPNLRLEQFRSFLSDDRSEKQVVVVIDALNQLDESALAQQLLWLPSEFAENIRVIVSCAEESPVLKVLRGRDWNRISIASLADDERLGILKSVPSISAKTLSDEQIAVLLENPATENPLYLLIALEELRGFGSFDLLDQKIASLPQGDRPVVDLFDQVIERLEGDFSPGIVEKTLSLLAASRRGLTESELLVLVESGIENPPGSVVEIATQSKGDLFPLLRQLRPYLQKRGELLGFHHEQLRDSIVQRYLSSDKGRLSAHSQLARFFEEQPGLMRERKPDELPWQLTQAEEWDRLGSLLTDLTFLREKCDRGRITDLLDDFERAEAELQGDQSWEEARQFLIEEAPWLRPEWIGVCNSFFWQLAFNQPSQSTVSRTASKRFEKPNDSSEGIFEIVNRPTKFTPSSCIRVIHLGAGELRVVDQLRVVGTKDKRVTLIDLESSEVLREFSFDSALFSSPKFPLPNRLVATARDWDSSSLERGKWNSRFPIQSPREREFLCRERNGRVFPGGK